MLRSVPVLCYHKVSYSGGITPEEFEKHLEYFKTNKFTTISCYELYRFITENSKIPAKPLVLTFDDCYLDNWVYAVPMLSKYDFKGIFFAITSFTGEGNKRNNYLSNNIPKILDSASCYINALKNDDKSQFMNENELYSSVHDYGHEIYSHSASHQMCFKNLKLLGKYPEKWHWGMYSIYDEIMDGTKYFERGSAYAYNGFWPYIDKGNLLFRKRNENERYDFCISEFKRSKKYLENLLNRKCNFFCWPWGHFDELSMSALKETGYKGSFTLERFPNSFKTNPYKINRIAVGDNKSVKWLNSRMKMYSTKITSTIFFKKYKKSSDINNILFITDSDKSSSGGIKQLTYNIESLHNSNVTTFLVCKKNAQILNTVNQYVKETAHVDFNKKLSSALKLLKFIKNNNIKIIHTYHNKGHKLGFITTLLNLNKNKLYINRGVLRKPNNLLYYINPIIDGFTCNSKKCLQALKSRFINKNKINVIYNHIKVADYGKVNFHEENPVICYIGNNNPLKGFDRFNNIVKQAKNTLPLRAVAVGLDNKRLNFEVDENITIIPDSKNVFQYLIKSNIFILTSRSESFPNVILEAMTLGLPVLASNVGAVPEIITNGQNGFVCKNHEEFVEKLLLLSNNEELWHKISRHNYKFVRENFDMNLKAEKLIGLYSGQKIIDNLEVKK